jgi:peptide/nickel transport system substrate-binding protein
MNKKTPKLSRRGFFRLTGGATMAVLASQSRGLVASVESNLSLVAQSGGALVMAIGTEPVGLDPCNPWFLGSGLWGMLGLPYDSWWRYTRDLEIVPDASTGWTRPDETTIIFDIREGIKYHNSDREVVADDVVWNYERMTNPDLACAGSSAFDQHIESITAVDKYKFQVKLKTPNLLLSRIPLPPILDPGQAQENGDPLLMKFEAGTGPWILDQWETENFISFKRNDDYWGKQPLFEEFRFQVMPEERATVAAMRAGQLNFLAVSRIENFVQLQNEQGINTWSGPSLEIRRLNVNHLREPFKNPDILQALRVGLNRQQFVDTLTQGLGQVSGSMSPAVTRYALSADEIAELEPYDPDQAKSLLSKAGYDEKDNRLRLDLLSISGFKDFTDIAQIAQANLRDIGVDIEIRIQEIGVWVDSRIKLKDYDLSVNDWGTGYDPDYTFYRSDQSEQEWTGGGDPELDKLIDDSNVEQDDDKRKELLQDIQRKIITNVRELYLYSPPSFEAASDKITGYTPWPGSTNLRVFDLDQVSVSG